MAGLVYYLIKSGRFNFKLLESFFSFKNIFIIVLIFLLLLTAHMFFAKRYQMAIKASGYRGKLSKIFNIIMIGLFYNNFLPGGVGGDVIRIYYIKKQMNVPIASGSATTLLDRGIGMLGLSFVALVSLAVSSLYVDNTLITNYLNLIIIAVIFIFLSIAAVPLMRSKNIFSFIMKIFEKLLSGFKIYKHIESFMNTIHTLVKNTKTVILSFLLCIAGHIITLTCIAAIAYKMYGTQSAIAALGVSGIVLLSTVIPITPGNIGWTEWIADNMFLLFNAEGGATVFAVWRLMMLLFSLMGGLIYLKSGSGSLDEIKKEDDLLNKL